MDRTPTREIRRRGMATAIVFALSLTASLSASAGSVNASALQADDYYDQFIVKYRSDSAVRSSATAIAESLNSAARALPNLAGGQLRVERFRRMALGAEVIRSSHKLGAADAETLMRQIAADPAVEYVELDARMYPTLTPNDPRYPEQWGYTDADAGIRADQAWDLSTGAGQVVAVLDTGITAHSDLNANVLPGYDFISNLSVARDGNGRDPDASDPGDSTFGQSSWHGTHVAGTVAAVTNNGNGVAGTAFNAKIVPVRVLGVGGGFTSDIADAIVWASGGTVGGVPANANPARVINLSLGGSGSCPGVYTDAINGAVSRGTTVVVAAGNGNANAGGFTPANCANVITVGAVDSNGARSIWNNGQASNYGEVVDVAAPGTGILSTLNSGTTAPGGESYAFYNGTSMAAPHVAGVVALIQARASSPKSPAEIEDIIKRTARAFPSTPSQPIGTGIVDAKAAVDAVSTARPFDIAPVLELLLLND
ncbi:S8 family peptidase [Pseudomonas sp. CGJS7]|uniref:S8 family peptidase n=1 Tax=Pseudomonas sp. CGJS7 TaxID=3109348 RepID=UPI003009BB64